MLYLSVKTAKTLGKNAFCITIFSMTLLSPEISDRERQIEAARVFWSMVDRNGPFPHKKSGIKTQCWVWTGGIHSGGGGQFKSKGVHYFARRFAWRQYHFKDAGPMYVSCACGNHLCVRHLELREPTEPLSQTSQSNRLGSGHFNAKLTEELVLQIHKAAKLGVPRRQIAEAVEVSQGLISQILTGRIWKHVRPE